MKAKITYTGPYTPKLSIGEIVDIVPGMETDAEGIWNAPAGKLVLCRKNDGTHCYASMLHMEIVDGNSTDWSDFRREAAKDIVCALLQDSRTSYSQPYEWFCQQAIGLADELIKQLKEDEK